MKIKRIIVVIIIFMLSILNVNAIGAGVSGSGNPSSGGGSGVGGTTSSGYKLGPAIVLKFSLIDVSNYYPKSLYSAYMINKGVGENDLSAIFLSNKNHNFLTSTPGKIIGSFGETLYETISDDVAEFPSDISFSQSIIKSIIPNSGYLNFNFNNLKSNLISCSGTNCVNTPHYEKVVIYMLEKSGVLSSSVSSLDDLDVSTQISLNKYRIAIEPVYNLKKNDNNYMFATPKAIANFVMEGKGEFGVYASSLVSNIAVTDAHGQSINTNPSYYTNGFYSLSDMRNGEGYILSFLTPQDNMSCKIELKADGNYYFKDKKGGEYYFDNIGDNLEYYLIEDANTGSGCGCALFDDISNNPYRTNIMLINNELYQNKYNSLCLTQKCTYTIDGTNYKFVDKNGNFTSSYEEFINSCGCTNEKVLTLKNLSGFKDIYDNSSCANYSSASKYGSINNCSSTEYKAANTDENLESYNLGYETNKGINTYCSLKCNEDISINNLKGKYTTEAGKYFYFKTYPDLKASKTCNVTVKYNTWYNDYYDLVEDEVAAYNRKSYSDGIKNPFPVGKIYDCCGDGCIAYEVDIKQVNYTVCEFRENYIDCQPKSFTYNDVPCKRPSSNYSSGTLSAAYNKVTTHFEKLSSCYNYLNNLGNITEYYKYDVDMRYYYEQQYSKSSIGIKVNTDRPNNIDDSKLDKTTTNNETGNFKSSDFLGTDKKYPYINLIEDNENSTNTSAQEGIGNKMYSSDNVEIKRIANYETKFSEPSAEKYVDAYNSTISGTLLDNYSKLVNKDGKNVYDIDVSAVAKDNNQAYYKFYKLGDEDKTLFNAFKNTSDSIKRSCDFKITSNVTDCDGNDCKLNVVYRSVDPSNIDPNKRLKIDADGDLGFSNWDNKKGYMVKEKIEKDATTKNTYSPNNLEYSFTLDSATIAAIRNYNEEKKDSGKNYDEFDNFSFDCNNEGNECESVFITQASDGTFVDADNNPIKAFAKKVDGRDKWKYMTYDESTYKWSIESYNKGVMTQALFNEYKEKLGGITP